MDTGNIAAQLYTVREFLQTPEDIASTLRRIKEIGYDAVQISGMGPVDPDQVKKWAEELRLSICATHIGFDRLRDDLDGVIAVHKLWNCEYVGIGSLPEAYRGSRDGYEAFIREFSCMGRELEAAGLHLVYHNHNFEFERFDGATGMELLLAGAGPGTYSLEIDTYWVQAGGACPVEWIEKANGRIKVVHLKDMAVVARQPVFAEIGEGNLNWQSLIGACRESGVQWYVVEQDVCRRDPFESLAMSLSYLRNMVRGARDSRRPGGDPSAL